MSLLYSKYMVFDTATGKSTVDHEKGLLLAVSGEYDLCLYKHGRNGAGELRQYSTNKVIRRSVFMRLTRNFIIETVPDEPVPRVTDLRTNETWPLPFEANTFSTCYDDAINAIISDRLNTHAIRVVHFNLETKEREYVVEHSFGTESEITLDMSNGGTQLFTSPLFYVEQAIEDDIYHYNLFKGVEYEIIRDTETFAFNLEFDSYIERPIYAFSEEIVVRSLHGDLAIFEGANIVDLIKDVKCESMLVRGRKIYIYGRLRRPITSEFAQIDVRQ